MSIQPGVGYSFTSSGSGTTLDINQTWSSSDFSDSGSSVTDLLADSDFINQFLIRIVDTSTAVPSTQVMKIAAGGHIYLRNGESCDKTAFTNTIYHDTAITVVNGSTANSHWCNDDGYVEISEESCYVYAYRVDALEESFFYIYVSTTDNLDAACPATLPEGITAPTGDYSVQCLKIGSAVYSGGWTVYQRLVGSITWPSAGGSTVSAPEQFTLKVVSVTSGESTINALKVARGRVITESLRSTSSMAPPTTNLQTYSVENFAAYPTGTLTTGTSADSLWASDDGYVQLLNASEGGADLYNVYLIRNNFPPYSMAPFGDPGVPMLAVMTLDSDGELKTRAFGTQGFTADWRHKFTYKQITVATSDPPYEVTFNGEKSQGDALVNYNCQRVKIGNAYWDGTGWQVTQELIGTLTLPDYIKFTGTDRWDEDDTGSPPWASWPVNQSDNDSWHDSWSGYDKNASGASVVVTN